MEFQGSKYNSQGPAFSKAPSLNRHQRRRQEALMRQNKGRHAGKAPRSGKGARKRPGPGSGPQDPRLLLLQKLTQWAVEGINEDGTFLAFRARFQNGDLIAVLDPTDELNAELIVRSALQGVAEQGFVGFMMPTVNQGQIQMARQRSSARSADMDKALETATRAIARKYMKPKENNDHDPAIRSDDRPAPGIPGAGASPKTDPCAAPGSEDPEAG